MKKKLYIYEIRYLLSEMVKHAVVHSYFLGYNENVDIYDMSVTHLDIKWRGID